MTIPRSTERAFRTASPRNPAGISESKDDFGNANNLNLDVEDQPRGIRLPKLDFDLDLDLELEYGFDLTNIVDVEM